MITLTKAAEIEIRKKLDTLPIGARIRIHVYGTGCQCQPQHPEGQISFSQTCYNDDEFFEINGIPCVMSRDAYADGNLNLRIGIAGLFEK